MDLARAPRLSPGGAPDAERAPDAPAFSPVFRTSSGSTSSQDTPPAPAALAAPAPPASPAPPAPPASPAARQAALAAALADLQRGAAVFSFPTFLCFLGCSSDTDSTFCAPLKAAAWRLLAAAGGPVYLADGLAFVPEALPAEFPELRLFRLGLPDAFVQAPGYPGFWIETQYFARLRSLAPMRRELRELRDVPGLAGRVEALVRELLGL